MEPEIVRAEFSYEFTRDGKRVRGTIDAANVHFALAHLYRAYRSMTDLRLYADASIRPPKPLKYITFKPEWLGYDFK